jgi:hypothetical protein
MAVIIGMLVKNEANRYLKRVLDKIVLNSDRLIVLDDASEDDTVEICRDYGAEIHLSPVSLWETNEYQQRYKLLELCLEKSSESDFIGIIDADEIISIDTETMFSPVGNMKHQCGSAPNEVTYMGLPLFDMWSETHYREDKYWVAHRTFWPLFVRAKKELLGLWPKGQRLHCGRFPYIPRDPDRRVMAFRGYHIKHMGWATPKDRYSKFLRYMKIDSQGIYGILDQYLSIMDPYPNIVYGGIKI